MKVDQPPVNWLIEEGAFSEDISSIIEEIEAQGMKAVTVKYIPFGGGQYDFHKDDECVMTLGSINLVRQIQREKKWVPGYIANFDNFKCSTYYAYWGQYLFNSRYMMLPLGEFFKRFDEIDYQFGETGLFIRPNDGLKTFAGNVIRKIEEAKYIEHLNPETLIVVAPAKKIDSEFRIFCSKNKVISASMYYDSENTYLTKEVDLNENVDNDVDMYSKEQRDISDGYYACRLAQQILFETKWRPDPIFAMDICIDHCRKQPYLLEINSLSCSGWYKASIAPLIKEITKIAQQEWTDIACPF